MVKNKLQVFPTLKRKGLFKEMNTRRWELLKGHPRICLPQMIGVNRMVCSAIEQKFVRSDPM